jgi:hypothetical protein
VRPAKASNETPRRRERLPLWEEPVQRVQLLVGTLIAILALPSAAYGVYKLVHREPAPVHLRVAVDGNPRHNRPWRTDHGVLQPRPGTRADPSAVGYVYTVHVVVRGLSGKSSMLSWAVQDPNGAALPAPRWAPLSTEIRAGSDDYETAEEIWVPVPLKGDAWIVAFTLANRSTAETARSQPEYVFESGGTNGH